MCRPTLRLLRTSSSPTSIHETKTSPISPSSSPVTKFGIVVLRYIDVLLAFVVVLAYCFLILVLCLKARPLFSSSSSVTFPSFKHLKQPIALSTKTSKSSITMSIVEHVVLFKVRDDTDQGKVNAMLNNLNGLVSLDPVLHLTAGPVIRTKSPISNFTHMLHGRYKSKEDLNAYGIHPDHQRVVKENVVPICDDIMAVDWVADNDPTPLSPPPSSAIKVTFLKLKENVQNEVQGEILGEMKGISGVQQITCGENFSVRAKGFSLASVIVFAGVEEMEAAVGKEEHVNLQKQKVKDNLEGVIVVDYVMPALSP